MSHSNSVQPTSVADDMVTHGKGIVGVSTEFLVASKESVVASQFSDSWHNEEGIGEENETK